MADSGEKTEKATPKKRQDARKKGNVLQSKDVSTFVSLIIMFSVLRLYFPIMARRMFSVLQYYEDLAMNTDVFNQTTARSALFVAGFDVGILILPLILLAAFVGVMGTAVQTRFLFSYESLKPKFSKLNPLQGIKRMFSLKSTVELIKNILKMIVIIVVIYRYVISHMLGYARMLDMGIEAATVYFLKSIFTMCLEICVCFMVIAAADFMYQRYDYNKNLMMSKQEVKEEYKQMEGDPKVKGKIKEMQRKMATSRMMQQVPEADVIIRNPTHYAVALKYTETVDIAPRVIAKGVDEMALRMVRIGENHGVYIQEAPELTRAIYATAEIGDLIPPDYYNAVADILALIYRIKGAAL